MNEENDIIPTTDTEKTAAEILHAARTTGRRKREIATIAKQLCIREEFLEALESGNYTAIPELVYILGFARNYAMELGLDPDDIVMRIKREMGISDDGADNDELAPVVASNDASETPRVSVRTRIVSFLRRFWKWLAAACAVLIAIIVALIIFWPRGDNTPVADINNPITTSADTAYTIAVRERFGMENRDTSNVVLQATSESWVKIEDGRGNTVFSRVLVPGDIYYVPAGDRYRATLGNAGGIDAWVNGKLAPKLGPDHVRKSGISMSPDKLIPAAE